jgi:hypothetical protein
MADRHGHELPRKTVRPGPVRCDGTNADVVQLAAGSACDLFAEFEVRPDADQLRTITLTLDGITRDAAAVPVRVVFEKD